MSAKSNIDTVVFDIGGVLVDWNPRYLYRQILPDQPEFMEWFLAHVCTSDWNETQDGGRTLEEGTQILIRQFPEHEKLIRLFYERHADMFSGAFPLSVAALHALADQGTPIYGLTNWSHELYPAALERFDFLRRFRGTIVSGEEKCKKPERKIFEILTARFQIVPATTLFIDDRLSNIQTASHLGFQTLHFAGPGDLTQHLIELGLLAGTSKRDLSNK